MTLVCWSLAVWVWTPVLPFPLWASCYPRFYSVMGVLRIPYRVARRLEANSKSQLTLWFFPRISQEWWRRSLFESKALSQCGVLHFKLGLGQSSWALFSGVPVTHPSALTPTSHLALPWPMSSCLPHRKGEGEAQGQLLMLHLMLIQEVRDALRDVVKELEDNTKVAISCREARAWCQGIFSALAEP